MYCSTQIAEVAEVWNRTLLASDSKIERAFVGHAALLFQHEGVKEIKIPGGIWAAKVFCLFEVSEMSITHSIFWKRLCGASFSKH